MKHNGLLALIATLELTASLCAQAPASPPDAAAGGLRFSIEVAKFENRSNYSGNFQLTDAWGTMLTDSLQQSGHFIVLGEADMRGAAMAEQDFAKSGRTAGGDKAPVTGQMTPAQLLVKGEITNFQTTSGQSGGVGFGGIHVGGGGSNTDINVTVYVVDSTTGQVVASKAVVGHAKSSGLSVGVTENNWSTNMSGFKQSNIGTACQKAIDEAVAFISAQIPNLHWSGTVIQVSGTKVFINRGTREGVAQGQVFKVGSSETLRDPGTGEVLDVSFTEKGKIKADIVKEKIAICSIVSGDGLANGMAVAPEGP